MIRTLGVVVAGGRGARLGHALPKALVRLGGVTLLERALEIVRGCSDEVLVVAPADRGIPVDPNRFVADLPGGAGPLAGVAAALGTRSYRAAIVLAVDFPLVRAAALDRLARILIEEGVPAVVPAPGGIPQPLAAAYAPAAGAALAESWHRGERAITAAVRALGPRLVGDRELEALEGGRASFLNVNTPADLVEAERRLARGKEPEACR